MKNYSVDKVRNFCIAGHASSGKTSLAELMLFKSETIDRLGNVQQKNTVSDYRDEEKERAGSIFSTPMHCSWKDTLFHFVDTPGYNDFQGEAISSLKTSDSSLVLVNASQGIETGTIRACKFSKGKPRVFFINCLDKENTNFFETLKKLQSSYGVSKCVPFTIPIGSGQGLSSVFHILRSNDFPEEILEEATKYKEAIMDTVAESDEELMMRYLDGENLSDEEISKGLKHAILSGDLIPVFAGSVEKDIGCEELMSGIVNLFPNPADALLPELKEGELEFSASKDTLGIIFKSVIDPFVGQLNYMKVVSGKFLADSEAYNVTTGEKERWGTFFVVNGKDQTPSEEATAGEIIAIPKLKSTHIGDTLSLNQKQSPIVPPVYPTPTVSHAIYSVKKGEDEKIAQALHKIAEEDPTITLENQQETHEFLVHTLGDLQFSIIINRVKKESKVDIDPRTPKVPYRETITAVGDASYRHKKQSGGAGQFGEVWMRLEPCPDQEYEFVSEIVGGNIPKNFFPAIDKGFKEAKIRGPIANCKVINIRAIIYDGKYHAVDSNEMAFKIAARGAFKAAIEKAKPILLEPIMNVKIMVPDEYMGDVNGDINTRRGRIIGMGIEDGLEVLEAEVPHAELFSYSSTLRSITQGKGSFEMEFVRYDRVPSNVAKEIKATIQKEAEEG